jgi:ParB family chromosome partitioning protein
MSEMNKEKETPSKQKKGGLGRGLSALLNNADTDITVSDEYRASGGVQLIDVGTIEANPFQPRTEFEVKALNELSESIKVHGLIQPVTVRKMGYDKYQLISGERRTRASIMAGLERIPAYIRIANDQEMLEMALIENIQRENLNAIEVALSYKRLLEECNLKQEELGERVGKERSTVTNYLRLLKLPDEVQIGLQQNKISMGHAKVILSVEDPAEQIILFNRIETESISVRGAEEIVKQAKTNKTAPSSTPSKTAPAIFEIDDALKFKIEKIHQNLASNVAIKSKGNKGEIVISFKDYEDLERILSSLADNE